MQNTFPRKPLACAILLLSSLGAMPPAGAQATAAPGARQFTIPAGPLAPALRSFAAATGTLLIFDAGQAEGKTTAGLRGAYPVAGGFAALLDGTGLEAVRLDNGGYALRARASAPAAAPAAAVRPEPPVVTSALPAVLISGARSQASEGTGSYTAKGASTATGLVLSLRETPQSVSVLTRQQIEDQGLVTLDDAVGRITGLVMQKGYYSGNSGSFSARGFPISNMLVDGLPTGMGATGTYNADNADLVIYDRIEVVRGANGLTSGSGNPSAAINLVRKRPGAERQAAIVASAGRWNDYQLQLDAGGALNEAKTLRGRAVAAVQDKDQFYDVAHERTSQLYGILEADLAPGTTLTLGAHYRELDNDGGYQEFPTRDDRSQLGLPRSATLANAYDFWDQADKTAFAELERRFGAGWKARLAFMRRQQDVDMVFSSIGGSEGDWNQNTQAYRLDSRHDTFDAHVGGPFTLLGRTHSLSTGLSRRKSTSDNVGDWDVRDTPLALDPLRWDPRAASLPPGIDYGRWRFSNTVRESGLYGAAHLNLADPLSVIVGARSSWYDYANGGDGSGYKVAREITPYAGATLELDASHSAYASWTRIFQPQSAVDAGGKLLDPITGTNLEAGIKGEYYDGRLNASLAVFQVSQENRPINDLQGPSPCPGSNAAFCSRAAGEVESRGVEFEASGELAPGWQLMAGYSYVSARYVSDSDPANIGRVFDPDQPRHQFKAATSIKLPGALQGWQAGASLTTQDATRSSDDERIRQGGYTVVGLHASYRFDRRLELRLNVNNLFDKVYHQGLGWSTGGNSYGAPRHARVTLSYKL